MQQSKNYLGPPNLKIIWRNTKTFLFMLLFIYILAAIGALIILIEASIEIYYVVTSKKASTLFAFLSACGYCLILPFLSNLALHSTTGHPILWRVLTCCALVVCIYKVILLYNSSKESIHAIIIDIKSDKEISEEILNEVCNEIKKDERIKMVGLRYKYKKKCNKDSQQEGQQKNIFNGCTTRFFFY